MNKYDIFSLFSSKWQKIPTGIQNSTTNTGKKLLHFLDLFDLEFIEERGRPSDERLKALGKSIIKQVDELAVFEALGKSAKRCISSNLVLKSEFDMKQLISPSSSKGIVIEPTNKESNNAYEEIYFNKHVLGFSSSKLEPNQRRVFILEVPEMKLGKIFFDRDSAYIMSYDNIRSRHDVTIDPHIPEDESSFPVSKSEREKHHNKVTNLLNSLNEANREIHNLKTARAELKEAMHKKSVDAPLPEFEENIQAKINECLRIGDRNGLLKARKCFSGLSSEAQEAIDILDGKVDREKVFVKMTELGESAQEYKSKFV